MSKYFYSGSNSTALDASGSLCRTVLGRTIPSGQIFYLKELAIANASNPQVILLADCPDTVAYTATNLKATIPCAGVGQDSNPLTVRTWSDPGLKFSAGCSAVKSATEGGYFGVNKIEAIGYFVK